MSFLLHCLLVQLNDNKALIDWLIDWLWFLPYNKDFLTSWLWLSNLNLWLTTGFYFYNQDEFSSYFPYCLYNTHGDQVSWCNLSHQPVCMIGGFISCCSVWMSVNVTRSDGLLDPLRVVHQVAEGVQGPEPPVRVRLLQLLEQLRYRPPAEGHRSPARVHHTARHQH